MSWNQTSGSGPPALLLQGKCAFIFTASIHRGTRGLACEPQMDVNERSRPETYDEGDRS